MPRWRVDDALASGSIPYDQDSFRSAVESVSEESAWREAADRAYEQAQRYSWDRTLAPLLSMLEPETPRA